jgi:ubiquinone/menaquinone biosynthesis C-methylase UbiE
MWNEELMDEKTRVREYWNKHVNTTQLLRRSVEAGSPEFYEAAHRARRESFPYILDVINGMEAAGRDLLEIGCGMGCDLVEFARRGARATGLDITSAGAALARKNLEWAGVYGNVLVGDAERLPFSDDSFDVAYSLGVLHHTPDTEGAINEVFRVLRPGGTALIMLYHRYSWFVLLSKLSGTNVEFADEDAPVVKTYSADQIGKMFKVFENVTIDFEGFPFRTPRKGRLAGLYNSVFVPVFNSIPRSLIKRTGFHLIIRAQKPK